MADYAAFLLTRQWRDARDGIELVFWATSDDGPLRIIYPGQEAVFFVEREARQVLVRRRSPRDLTTLQGEPVDACYFASQRELQEARAQFHGAGCATYESDIKPSDRFLMERFITGAFTVSGDGVQKGGYTEFVGPTLSPSEYQPALRAVSLDIETEGLQGALYSIGVAGPGADDARVFMIGGGATDGTITYCAGEAELLRAFFAWFREADPDLILGWNVVGFDLDFLQRKCQEHNVPFGFGRGGDRSAILSGTGRQSALARIPGRVVMDGPDTLRAATWSFESFSLDHVSHELLGRKKLITGEQDKLAEIRRLFREDKPQLAAYNLEDCRLVQDVFAKAGLLDFAVQRARLTGLAMDRQGGSVAAFDYLYLPRLHRKGCVAPDITERTDALTSPGGYVMESQPGLYDNVLVLDFKSLYPSIIRTFRIDPYGMAFPGEEPVPGYEGATFARDDTILPELIDTLWAARDEAKRADNAPMSQAIKIIMNSFYGVLGSTGCRFFDPRLAGSITRRGHDIITRSRDFIEEQGYRVIYGDTDSVFVLIGSDHDEAGSLRIGRELMAGLNDWWHEHITREFDLESRLEIEFETHYIRFVMPTIRGSDKGTKKRYAGYVRKGDDFELVFKGLESVRTDWTPLARDFQRELYRRVFFGEPCEDYIRDLTRNLMAGFLDEQLVYRKRIRRKLDDYQKNVPPHVQAARKLPKAGRHVSYCITVNGPEPVERLESSLDYTHYRDRQLAPVADGILYFLGTSFTELTDTQLDLFR